MRWLQDNRSLDLFEIPSAPMLTGGSLHYAAELCHTLSDAITDAMKRGVLRSRYDLAARMSELTGQEISKASIDAWTGESKSEWRFPFEYAAAFEAACDSTCLQQLLARKRGCRILVGDEALDAELGRVKRAQDELAQREKALRQRMKVKR